MSAPVLGIELGSTRIKSVLVGSDFRVLAQGSCRWESVRTGGFWSYSLEDAEAGLRNCYAALVRDYRERTGCALTRLSAIGISAMMHGYLAFDRAGRLLTPYRTWRNTAAAAAAGELTDLFSFPIPARWSVAHYYFAVRNREPHVRQTEYLTTLAGYVHERLTGERVLGIGDASGMFPVRDGGYDAEMLRIFDERLRQEGISRPFASLLPRVLPAGVCAGYLTEAGARWLDPTGTLQPGCPFCPPEGDAGTGMVATGCVRPGSANVSAGTSAFLTAVSEQPLAVCHREIDQVVTPTGYPAAMIHVNGFTPEIGAWADLFAEVIALSGGRVEQGALYDALYAAALQGDADCGGLLGYGFTGGEPLLGLSSGVPLLVRSPGRGLTLANLMKTLLFSAVCPLADGMDLLRDEGLRLDTVYGHGGFFKAPLVGQCILSAAIGAPVTVSVNAGEGGAWGIALLARFMLSGEPSLDRFLDGISAGAETTTRMADQDTVADFARFRERYRAGLSLMSEAAEVSECRKN